ncbi:hypothetical protein Pelo_4850 [Pelomyxa schiedti]|nr:hypothetical protein Pelo_4850 [Pelomyxa schiedti]
MSTARAEYHNRVVWLSRLLWDNVLPWLDTPTNGATLLAPIRTTDDAVTLLSVCEGVFPLVPRACRLILNHDSKYYLALEVAAEACAQSCLRWLIKHHVSNETHSSDTSAATENELNAGNNGNKTKELVHILEGLCCGGHLEMAQKLVAGVWPDPTIWSCDRFLLDDHVRNSDLLAGVCKKGHLDVVKWMVERFGYMDHPWELYGPMISALSKGRLEVAKWIVGSIGPQSLKKYYSGRAEFIQGEACRGGNVETVKWALEMFPVGADSPFKGTTAFYFLRTNCTAVCECIRDRILPIDDSFIDALPNAEVLSEMVKRVCPKEGGLDLLKWAVEEHSVTPTPEIFRAACKNQTENLDVMKWLSTKVSLSPEDACESFVISLATNNIATASWLDESFGIMKNTTTGVSSVLSKMCKHIQSGDERAQGVKWLLNHPTMANLDESLVAETVKYLLGKKRLSATPLFIIEKFPISEPTHTELLLGVLKESLQGDTLTQVKKVISMGEFTKESVAQCLANPELISFGSIKSVKWLITHFQLEREHITLDNNTLLHNLVARRQASCAEWLINRFHITLDEVLELHWDPSAFSASDLFTFQMMLRVFPGITSETVKQHWMCLVTHTPVMAQFTMRVFPDITTRDIAEYWSQQRPWKRPSSIRNWLGDTFPILLQL